MHGLSGINLIPVGVGDGLSPTDMRIGNKCLHLAISVYVYYTIFLPINEPFGG